MYPAGAKSTLQQIFRGSTLPGYPLRCAASSGVAAGRLGGSRAVAHAAGSSGTKAAATSAGESGTMQRVTSAPGAAFKALTQTAGRSSSAAYSQLPSKVRAQLLLAQLAPVGAQHKAADEATGTVPSTRFEFWQVMRGRCASWQLEGFGRPARQPIGRELRCRTSPVQLPAMVQQLPRPDRGSLLLSGHLLIRSGDAAVHHRMLRCSSCSTCAAVHS